MARFAIFAVRAGKRDPKPVTIHRTEARAHLVAEQMEHMFHRQLGVAGALVGYGVFRLDAGEWVRVYGDAS